MFARFNKIESEKLFKYVVKVLMVYKYIMAFIYFILLTEV